MSREPGLAMSPPRSFGHLSGLYPDKCPKNAPGAGGRQQPATSAARSPQPEASTRSESGAQTRSFGHFSGLYPDKCPKNAGGPPERNPRVT
jgi:hypothetical protein